MSKLLLIFGILISLLIRSYFIFNGSEVADIHSLKEMGELTLRGVNPFYALSYNSYHPLALYLEAYTVTLSQNLDTPFYILTKLWPNLADLLIGIILYLFLIKKGTKPILATIWSLIFLLNPISIIISSAHGQIDSIPTFFIILAIYLLEFKQSKIYFFLTALVLGISASIKPNPIILWPFFLLFMKTKFLNKALFLVILISPLALSLLPFYLEASSILGKIFSYSGANDFGLAAVIKMHYFQSEASLNPPIMSDLLRISKFTFLIGLIFLIFFYTKSKNLILGCLGAYLLFLTIYFGVSAQYLSWVLPFAVLAKDKMIVPFSISATIALLGFYFYFNPTILLSQFSAILPYQAIFIPIYTLGNLLLWIITAIWTVKVLKNVIIPHNYASS